MNAKYKFVTNVLCKHLAQIHSEDIKEILRMGNTTKDNKAKSMSIYEVAKEMGKSQSFVRIGLQRGRLPFGIAEKISTRYTYYISPAKFYNYIGKELPAKYR